ncbi:helix-turn-helix domain-containing protein [Paenibacillus medicaginis]|uniref:MerR family DNA-binding protein n=1 Tax=Paenibacillus medicaginis TaxID=1470560 RepID=A0ABV5C2Z4_9BACL
MKVRRNSIGSTGGFLVCLLCKISKRCGKLLTLGDSRIVCKSWNDNNPRKGLLIRRLRELDYRNYSEEAVERLRLIKNFQSIGCSLAELKVALQDCDTNMSTTLQIIDWIRSKKKEIESKKEEYDQMLDTLNKMLEYKTLLIDDPQKAQELQMTWYTSSSN